MPNCYLCDQEITPDLKSDEHIILNALGGRLKSSKLLCKLCNSVIGEQADACLADQYLFFMKFLRIKRDKGESPSITGVTSEGEKYVFDGLNLSMAHPVFKKNETCTGIEYHIEARSEKEINQILSNIAKKNAPFDLQKAIKNINKVSEQPGPINYPLTFGGEKAFLSILKTAINFYLYNGGDVKHVSHCFNELKNQLPTNKVKFFYPLQPIYKKQANEVIHLLHINGSKYEKILYCYIEFFSLHGYLVVLNENYSGKQFSKTYAYELLSNKEIGKDLLIKIKRKELLSLPAKFSAFDEVTKRANRLMEVANRVQGQQKTQELFNQIYSETIESLAGPNGKILEEHMKAFSNRFAEEFVKQISNFNIKP